MTKIAKSILKSEKFILRQGDCRDLIKQIPDSFVDLVVTSPPYFMGKEYDSSHDIDDFISFHETFLPEILRVTKPGGSICWQVGYFVRKSVVEPLDYHVHKIMSTFSDLKLRNRLIWQFGHGLHASKRFSGRHEVVLWYTKGDDYYFDLDSVRVPQKYPGKRYYKGEKKGQISGNPQGKNPSDIWDIPNVNANHIEKTEHPCQFPVGLVERLVKGLTPAGGVVFDPFSGAASTGVATLINNRFYIGFDTERKYCEISLDRLLDTINGSVRYRSSDIPIYVPDPNTAVAKKPEHFKYFR